MPTLHHSPSLQPAAIRQHTMLLTLLFLFTSPLAINIPPTTTLHSPSTHPPLLCHSHKPQPSTCRHANFHSTFNNRHRHRDIAGFFNKTNEEFIASRNGNKSFSRPRSSTSSYKYENFTAVPSTMDWRKKGAITPIKDQGQCGCCWAFSAVAATEGINQLTTDKLISLSEQELVDCDTSGEDQGCEGGLMDDAFEFIQHNRGLTTESLYPYKGVDATCNKKAASSHAAKITGFEDVPANNENALLKAVANQPISVAIDASGSAFQFYSSGVFTGDCGTDLDHGVTAIGYGTTSNGTKYWLVKN